MIEAVTSEACTLHSATRDEHNKPAYAAGVPAACLYSPLMNHVETDDKGQDVIVDGCMIFRPGVTISEEYRVTYDGDNYRIIKIKTCRMPGILYVHHYEVYLKRTK